MARKARELSKSGMYRVTLRGDELFKDEADKTVFCDMLKKHFETGEVYGINLKKTEINLVVKEGEKGISMTMKPLMTSYARYFNKKHGVSGKLFSGRFISVPIETDAEKNEQLNLIETGTVKHAKKTAGTQKRAAEKKRENRKKSDIAENTRTEETVEKIKPKQLPSWLL